MISCYYKDTAAALYTQSLKEAMERVCGIEVKIVSADCMCNSRYRGVATKYQGVCEFCVFPRVYSSPNDRRSRLFTQTALDICKGLFFLRKCNGYDVVHYQQCLASFGFPPLLTLFATPSQLLRVVTLHEIDFWQARLPFLNEIYKKADAIIVHANATRRKLLSHVDLPDARVKVIPHGVWVPPLKRAPRKEITFFGVPTKRKGIHILLKALRILKEEGINLAVHVYGNYNEEEKTRWSHIAQRMGIKDRLCWEGYVNEESFTLKMQQSLFTILPYLSSEASSVLLRAMACATPVIASCVGGIPEYLGDTGILISPNDPEALACAMIKLFDDPDMITKIGIEERERAAAFFSWDRIAERTVEIYRSLP